MSATRDPLVSILMPVYNGEEYLREAMNSILGQTYCNIEILVINDGSTDKSVSIMESYRDARIRLVHNETNLKIVASLNKGLKMARGKYIARMDCDDISYPTRIEKQVKFMEENLHIGICATGMWRQESRIYQEEAYDPSETRHRLLFYCCLGHPTVMIRKEALDKQGLSYLAVQAEDYDLWVRASKVMNVCKLGESLVFHRRHPGQLTQFNRERIKLSSNKIISQQLGALDIPSDQIDWNTHRLIGDLISGTRFRRIYLPPRDIADMVKWLDFLIQQNKKIRIYEEDRFNRFINNIKIEILDFYKEIDGIRKLSDQKKIYLFGSGRMGEAYLENLQKNGITVEGILDNASVKWSKSIRNVPILDPQVLKKKNSFFIIITSVYVDEIAPQLEAMGLKDKVDFIKPLY